MLAAALAVACGTSPAAEPPKPPPDAAPVAEVEAPPDAGQDLDKVRQVAFADVIKRSYPAAQRCWEKAAADDFHLAGTVTLAVHFGPGGRLARVEVVADGAGDGVLTACLTQLFQDAEWPAVFEPNTSLQFPFQFEQPGAQYTVRREDVAGGRLMHPANTGNPAFELDLVDRLRSDLQQVQAAYLVGNGVFVYAVTGSMPALGPPLQAVRLRLPRSGMPPRKPPAVRRVDEASVAEIPIAGGRGAVKFGFVERGLYMGTIRLDAGVEVPEHDHPTSTEVLYVLEGSGTMTVAGKKYPVAAGTAIQIPPGVKHGFSAGAKVKVVQFYTPSGPEQRFKVTP